MGSARLPQPPGSLMELLPHMILLSTILQAACSSVLLLPQQPKRAGAHAVPGVALASGRGACSVVWASVGRVPVHAHCCCCGVGARLPGVATGSRVSATILGVLAFYTMYSDSYIKGGLDLAALVGWHSATLRGLAWAR